MAIGSFEIISVPVSDPERAKRFYRDVVGFEFDSMRPGGLQGVMFNDPDGNGWILRQPPD